MAVFFLLAQTDPSVAPANVDIATEMKVVEQFLGNWQTQVAIYPSSSKDPIRSSGKGRGETMVEGRYVRFSGRSDGGVEDMQIMTFDPVIGKFRQFHFDSEGNRFDREGTWDPRRRVLTWTGTNDGLRFRVEDHFVDTRTIRWTLTATDDAGRIVRRIDGVLYRVTEPRNP